MSSFLRTTGIEWCCKPDTMLAATLAVVASTYATNATTATDPLRIQPFALPARQSQDWVLSFSLHLPIPELLWRTFSICLLLSYQISVMGQIQVSRLCIRCVRWRLRRGTAFSCILSSCRIRCRRMEVCPSVRMESGTTPS